MAQFKGPGGFGNKKRTGRPQFGASDSRPGGFDRDRRPVELFKATCSTCSKSCEVPFRPTNDRPVFCRDCFQAKGAALAIKSVNRRGTFDRVPVRSPAPFPSQPREFRPHTDDTQFIALNKKLDMIAEKMEKLDALIRLPQEIAAIEHATAPAKIVREKKPAAKKKSRRS